MIINRVPRYLSVALLVVLIVVGYLVIVKRPLSVEVVELAHDVPVQVSSSQRLAKQQLF